jgi:four helix bundle protein
MSSVGKYEFSFERLDVYQRSLKFVDQLFNICDRLDHGLRDSLGMQLRNAALSITNNIAEGSDKRSRKERAQFYGYALDSARECASMLNILRLRRAISDESSGLLREECVIICKMLRRLIDSTGR